MRTLEEILAQFKDPKQRIFVEARLRGMEPAAAARAAGLERHYETVHPEITAIVAEYAAQEAPRMSMTRERLTEMLLDTYRNAATAGEQVAAVRELGKLHGLYAPQKLQVENNVNVNDARSVQDLRHMTIEQLEQLSRKRAGQVIEGEVLRPRAIAHAG